MPSIVNDRPVLIVGGGLAGLFAALKLAPLPVVVITPRPLGEGASSAWAQAGIAAAIGKDDSFDLHTADTIVAGAGLCDETMVRLIVKEAPARIDDLLRYGVPFDRDSEGHLRQSREAAHSTRRVIGVSGDRAGREIMAALIARVSATPSIRVVEDAVALDLTMTDGTVTGLLCAVGVTSGHAALQHFSARAVVLATGGIGQLFDLTTNPPEARGDGLAIAARAGAVIADAEFVQFHPTAIDVGKHPAPLATEALRGEGAYLINTAGERFMLKAHPDAELAPRDIVARAVQMERASGRGAFLDCRSAINDMAAHFPTVYAACHEAGLDPAHDPIPVAPAAHYHMGGVATDANARSSVSGLWAIGEVASTGLHGANRLASNSLLEAVVMAARAAEDIADTPPSPAPRDSYILKSDAILPPFNVTPEFLTELQECMTANAGVVRSAESLFTALELVERLASLAAPRSPLANMTDTARFVIIAALHREESRGSHYRTDFPTLGTTVRRSFLTHAPALQLSANILAMC
jgi:L-aspartate oxidase